MGKIDSTNSEQLDFNRLGEAYFDCASVVAERGYFQFAVRGQGKPYKTIIVETAADRNGNLQGYIDVYLGSAVNGSPWRSIPMGGGRSGPCPAVDFFTFVPRVVGGAPSLGTVSITVSTEIWGSYFRKPATATYFPLEDLTDAAISSPVAGQVLTWNGTDWVNATPSGGSSVEGVNTFVYTALSPGNVSLQTLMGTVAGQFMTALVLAASLGTTPTGWALIHSVTGAGNAAVYTRTASGDSGDAFNLSTFGSCVVMFDTYDNVATGIVDYAGSTTAFAAISTPSGVSELRVGFDNTGTAEGFDPPWVWLGGNSVSGRSSIVGSRRCNNAHANVKAIPQNVTNGYQANIIFAVQ